MKKNSFAITAIILAIGINTFTIPEKKRNLANYTFYIITDPATAWITTDVTNWQLIEGSETCNTTGVNNRACQITIPDVYVDQTQSPALLKDATFLDHVVITASTISSPSNRYYVMTLKNQAGATIGSIHNDKAP